MTATNHSLTGAAIGLAVGSVWLAIPVALASHFVLDAIPHFGFSDIKDRGRRFTTLLATDTSLCVLLVVFLYLLQPTNWWIAALSAFAAASPDFMWAPGYFREKFTGGDQKGRNAIMRFHAGIQRSQTPRGAFVEVAWAAILIAILAKFLV